MCYWVTSVTILSNKCYCVISVTTWCADRLTWPLITASATLSPLWHPPLAFALSSGSILLCISHVKCNSMPFRLFHFIVSLRDIRKGTVACHQKFWRTPNVCLLTTKSSGWDNRFKGIFHQLIWFHYLSPICCTERLKNAALTWNVTLVYCTWLRCRSHWTLGKVLVWLCDASVWRRPWHPILGRARLAVLGKFAPKLWSKTFHRGWILKWVLCSAGRFQFGQRFCNLKFKLKSFIWSVHLGS